MEPKMDRSWFGTVRMMELEIGVMVIVVLMALVVITARLARDPSESAARWLAERARSARLLAQHPAEPAARASSSAMSADEQTPAPEWLDRLLGRDPEPRARPAGDSQGEKGPDSGRRVA
jgi:hypothetical protein